MASFCTSSNAEDGYRLWLRNEPLDTANIVSWQSLVSNVQVSSQSETSQIIRQELSSGLKNLLGKPVPFSDRVHPGSLIIGTVQNNDWIAQRTSELSLNNVGDEGYQILSTEIDGSPVTLIAANTEIGALYGSYHWLRLMQTGKAGESINIVERPRFNRRILNHWDNLDGSIERGYAGRSLWQWEELPEIIDPRLNDYARANASIGINGSVLNNVNSNATSLTHEYLLKTAAIADRLRPYGIRVYLSARFSAPMQLGGIHTADPLDPAVVRWWQLKADEIYALIPDFGGFLVKANSEGQPGPLTYNRSHADGANMLAAALKPHGGIAMWRAFVYEPELGTDRIAQAYKEFKTLDGAFADNAYVQIKNGPLDFQPREPFHPLFGGMPHTKVVPELQITQEYLGHSHQLAFLPPMWREFFDADTHAKGPGSMVAKVVDGSLFDYQDSAIAGVANTGSDRNWTGHDLAQSNWYAYGRFAWNPDFSPEQIAREWVQLTLTRDKQATETISDLLMGSREAVVNYSMPLGLHHLIWTHHHYGPEPWANSLPRPDWNPYYFHKASPSGIGVDRTATGSNAVAQYYPQVRDKFSDLKTCPENLILWFHRIAWDYELQSGKSLWETLCTHYQDGVDWVSEASKKWEQLDDTIDPERHSKIEEKFRIQLRDATRWKDACLLYFQQQSGLSIPSDVTPPQHTLEELKQTDPLSLMETKK